MSDLIFPSNFIFGAATAAYQIEGAVTEDGRGFSIWDAFSHRKGKIHQDQNGDVACGHWYGEVIRRSRVGGNLLRKE